MKPRHDPCYDQTDYPNEKFVGYIEEFDMYIDADQVDGKITLVGDRLPDHVNNFDCFEVNGNELVHVTPIDLHVTPYHMCLIYAKAVEHGLIKEQEDEA
jgi:hypothetical protein